MNPPFTVLYYFLPSVVSTSPPFHIHILHLYLLHLLLTSTSCSVTAFVDRQIVVFYVKTYNLDLDRDWDWDWDMSFCLFITAAAFCFPFPHSLFICCAIFRCLSRIVFSIYRNKAVLCGSSSAIFVYALFRTRICVCTCISKS